MPKSERFKHRRQKSLRGLEIAPIDQDHWLLAVRKYLPGHASVDVCTLALQCRVAQQAIHALDALAHAGAPVQGAGQVR